MTHIGEPAPLTGCGVLPALDTPQRDGPAKRTPPRRRLAGRFALLNAFIDGAVADLNRAEVAVWLVLYRDSRDGIARTGQADIARRVGVNRKTVYRAIRRLKHHGLLVIVRRGGLGRGPSAYRVRAGPK